MKKNNKKILLPTDSLLQEECERIGVSIEVGEERKSVGVLE